MQQPTSSPFLPAHPEAGPALPDWTQLSHLSAWLQSLGALPLHLERLYRLWSQALPPDPPKRSNAHFLPAAVRAQWPAVQAGLAGLLSLRAEHPGADGSARLLLGLHDGQTVEAVLLPRDGLCVSSQVGCAVGCRFCMTGTEGLIRQVGSAEIVAQVALARRHRLVKKVVFMGMGEPAHNLDNVMDAIDLLGRLGNIGHKNLVLSSVGDERLFARLDRALRQGPVRPALALSLHTTRAELRAELLPRAPRIAPQTLVEAADTYARASGYPVQYQWTLLAGINDSQAELDGIVQLLSGRYGVLNMIPYNAVQGLPFERPSWERAAEIARHLHRRGILTKLRNSAGQDVDGGCGQLRVREALGRRIPIQAQA